MSDQSNDTPKPEEEKQSTDAEEKASEEKKTSEETPKTSEETPKTSEETPKTSEETPTTSEEEPPKPTEESSGKEKHKAVKKPIDKKKEKRRQERSEQKTKQSEERKAKRTEELTQFSTVKAFKNIADEVMIERAGYHINRNQMIVSNPFSKIYKAKKLGRNPTELCIKLVFIDKIPRPHRQHFVDNSLKILKFVGKKGGEKGDKTPEPKCEHFVKIYDIFMAPNKCYIFMEEVLPLSVYTRIKTKDTISEFDVKKWGKHLAEAIDCLQVSGIAHRNIRTENIIFDRKYNIKLVGFGSAVVFWNEETQQSITVPKETPLQPKLISKLDHLPPNCLKEEYDPSQVDVWSWGVFVCILLHKLTPFDMSSKASIEEQWTQYATKFQFNPELKQLLDKCFVTDGNSRIKSDEILGHKWLREKTTKKK